MSEEKSLKGLSLRRKKTVRPTISAPRQLVETRQPSTDSRTWDTQTTASGISNSSNSRPDRPKIGTPQTSDLVKRRYSTRFAGGFPQDGITPPIPSVPALPPQFTGASGRSRSDGESRQSPQRDGKMKVDGRALKDPNLQAEKYIQGLLADASEVDIHTYQKELQAIRQNTDADLRHNVYQNRTQFVKISKEADKLKSEMRTLRTLMGELTGALGHATSAAGADLSSSSSLTLADRKRANRSSVANLEALWTTHLQTLWKRVEGSQKYLPALPGRHILMESQRWLELNAATWKPRRRVAMVLLNDHLLVATAKKRNDASAGPNQMNNPSSKAGNRNSTINPATTSQSQTVLVADRCWPLHDVSLADISTTASVTVGHNHTKENKNISNAINIRAGNESFTYATYDAAEKSGFLVAFRRGQEDLRKQIAVEHGEREKALDELAMLTGGDARLMKKVAAANMDADLQAGGLAKNNSVLVDVDGRPQSIRWVESQVDGLDIDIALQRFEEAVATVEKLRKVAKGIKGNVTAQEIILAKVNDRAGKLAGSIARQLSLNSHGAGRTQENVSWLLRLGFEELARSAYLTSRTTTIELRQRQLPFTGALEPYVHALAFVTFTLLLHTFRTFNAAFPASSGSAVVRWAKDRVDEFSLTLERHMSSIDHGSESWQACVKTVRDQAAVLNEVGVDFTGLVLRKLREI